MILGIDTSMYTTSMCLLDAKDMQILFEHNVMLTVKEGNKGLRQSEGFYQHVHQLTQSFDLLTQKFDANKITAIAVSFAPRNIEGSYMPVFNAGVLFCKNLKNALGVPLYQFSHQEGHLMAAVKSSPLQEIPAHFYGLHLSGGTTEFLDVQTSNAEFSVKIIGETLDLNFGQLIDRIGVKLGLNFPCGRAMDELAQKSQTQDFKKVRFKTDSDFNISGLENYFYSLVKAYSNEDLCRMVFNTIAHIIEQWLVKFEENYPVVISGGVASNAIIKKYLRNLKSLDKDLYFAKEEYARDNAYGIAILGYYKANKSS